MGILFRLSRCLAFGRLRCRVSCLQAVSKNPRRREDRSPVAQPRREPTALSKMTLEPGQSKQIQFVLPRDAFACWSPASNVWTVDAGNKFTIEAAVSERDIRASKIIRPFQGFTP